VALVYNHKTDEWVVVQGESGSVPLDSVTKQLGWSREDFVVDRHNHPVEKGTGETSDSNLRPSGEKADMSVAERDAKNRAEADKAAGGTARTHLTAIDVRTARGPDRVYVTYDPVQKRWVVDYPLPGNAPGRDSRMFWTMDEYHAWFKNEFGFEPSKAKLLQ
jgi:hypothetical protein